MSNNVISIDKPLVNKVKRNWYIGRVHGAVFFARSHSEVILKHRRWKQQKDQAKAAAAHFNNVVAMVTKAKEVS